MALTPPPTPPSTSDPANFDPRGDALMAWLPIMTAEQAALQIDVTAKQVTASDAAVTATQKADYAGAAMVGAQQAAQDASTFSVTAAVSAVSAVNAPGTSGTSATVLTLGAGVQTFTTQAAKAWVVGQPVTIARTSAPAVSLMGGVITAYNSVSGLMSVSVPAGGTTGAGTFTDWTVSLSGARGADGTPGVDASAGGGSTTSTSAVDMVLTSASTRLQLVTMTATGQSVTLPSGLTLVKGGPLYVIKNTGALSFVVRDADGYALAGLGPNQTAVFYCAGIATQAGVWAVGNQTNPPATFSDSVPGNLAYVFAALSTPAAAMSVARLTVSNVIVGFYDTATTYSRSVVLTVAGSVITVGALSGNLGAAAAASGGVRIVRLTDSRALLAYWSAGNNQGSALTLDVTGSTITPGAVGSFSAQVLTELALTRLTNSKALALYAAAGGNAIAAILNVAAGGAITVPTPFVFGTGGTGLASPNLVALSDTKTIAVYLRNDGYGQAMALTIVGDVISAPGAVLTFSAANIVRVRADLITATQLVVVHAAGVQVLDVTENTLTAGALTVIGENGHIAMLSPTLGMVQSDRKTYSFKIGGSVVSPNGAPITISSLSGSMGSIAFLSTGLAIGVFSGTSNYGTAIVLNAKG